MVPASSAAGRLEETFGGRLAYTNPESHSGYNAVRYHLSAYISESRKTLYRTLVGPLVTPRRVLEALTAGEADVGPLDSYAWSLLCRYEPELTRHVRILARSAPAPMPLLVASDRVDPQAIMALQTALLALNTEQDATLLQPVGFRGFITPPTDAWQVLCDRAIGKKLRSPEVMKFYAENGISLFWRHINISQHRPDYSRVLVSDRHGRFIKPAPFLQLVNWLTH